MNTVHKQTDPPVRPAPGELIVCVKGPADEMNRQHFVAWWIDPAKHEDRWGVQDPADPRYDLAGQVFCAVVADFAGRAEANGKAVRVIDPTLALLTGSAK